MTGFQNAAGPAGTPHPLMSRFRGCRLGSTDRRSTDFTVESLDVVAAPKRVARLSVNEQITNTISTRGQPCPSIQRHFRFDSAVLKVSPLSRGLYIIGQNDKP